MRGVRIGGLAHFGRRFVPHILDAKDTILQQDKAPAATAGPEDARAWTQRLLRYRDPSVWRSIVEIGISVGPLAALMGRDVAVISLRLLVAVAALSVPAAGFLVRLFMIQHDCGHGSFFRHRPPTTGSAAPSAS